MGRKTRAAAAVVVLALLAGCATVRVSVPSGGGQADGDSGTVAVNPDGRFVAFVSTATNLVPGDTNGQADVFVRDEVAHTTRLASVAADGSPADGLSDSPSISADGRIVSFSSQARNLTTDQSTSNGRDAFVRDMTTGVTTRLTQTSGFPLTGSARNPRVSADGRFVVFDQIAADPDHVEAGRIHVFVFDVRAGTTELVSTPADGPAPASAQTPSISADGRYVASANAPVAAPGSTPDFPEDNRPEIGIVIFNIGGPERITVVDRTTGHHITAPEVPETSAPGWQVQNRPSISADGRYVAFWAFTYSLVPGGTNDVPHVWLWDTRTDHLDDITKAAGLPATVWTLQPSVSRDGRRIAFYASDGPSSSPTIGKAVVYDRALGLGPVITLPVADLHRGGSGSPIAISDDGNSLVYASLGSDHVAGDTNGATDVFVRSLIAPHQFHPVQR